MAACEICGGEIEWDRFKDLLYGKHFSRTLEFKYCAECGEIVEYSFG